MKSRMDTAREILTGQILEDFKDEITGKNINRVVGHNPEEIYFVGKLMSINDEENQNNSFSSKTFIESISVDFYVSEEDYEKAVVEVSPRGEFYYRAYPTLEEQRDAITRNVHNITGRNFSSYDDLIEKYKGDTTKFKNTEIKLTPVFKKVSIEDLGIKFTFRLKDIYDETLGYGYIDKSSVLNVNLNNSLEVSVNDIVSKDEEYYRYEVKEKTLVLDLIDDEKYKCFIANNSKKDVINCPNWSLYIDVSVKKVKDRFFVSVSMVNDSKLFSNTSLRKDSDKKSVETMFNSGLDIVLCDADFMDIELDYFADDYKYDRTQKAIGTNCSIIFDEGKNSVSTNHLPTYTQYRFVTRDNLAIKFDELVSDPVKVLNRVVGLMNKEKKDWIQYKDEIWNGLTEKGKQSILGEINQFELEIKRFEKGIGMIKRHPIVEKSFSLMNKAFKNSNTKYDTWRLFQIVFIVSIIPDIVACDENLLTEDEKATTSLDEMALLYFPTGGGKTEAFLGVLVFNLFFDRYRGKNQGVTSILRYPLRLLSVQQVQRLANILAQAELLRRNNDDIKGTSEFSLGYFVGDGNTPNKLTQTIVDQYASMTEQQRDEGRVIDICPFCKKQTVHLDIDPEQHRLIHYCSNKDCESGKILPLYIVDNEIYRYLPSAIISTVDKLAIMGNNRNFRAIVNGANCKCPKHGYTTTDKCVEYSICKEEVDNFEDIDMYDPAPTLLIQDELHLINESLGAYASHYESFLQYYIGHHSKSNRGVKVIGATATISSYESQVYHLYRKDAIRFPVASPYVDRNFYAKTDYEDIQRRIMGYSPYGKAIINSVVYSLKYMRRVVYKYLANPNELLNIEGISLENVEEAKKILEDYWIFLEYNNVKRDSNNVEGALETPINVELVEEGITPFNTRKMTGDESFQDVRNVLAEVENTKDVFNGLNLISATSMISHGVDADRFNVMFFYGIPGNIAEYIQAYSRTGRRYSSIVIDIMRPSRETDQSYLKNFNKIHEFKDIMVEAVAINRWATKAIDNTLPGVFSSLLLNVYDLELQFTCGNLFFMKNIKKAMINDLLNKDDVKDMLYQSYGCNDNDSLGNQYRIKIEAFIDNIFKEISDRNWTEENIFNGFTLMGYRIMNSLRDTDTPLIIELEG